MQPLLVASVVINIILFAILIAAILADNSNEVR